MVVQRYYGWGVSKTFQVTYDAADPAALAAFWARALGYVVQPPPKGFPESPRSPTSTPVRP